MDLFSQGIIEDDFEFEPKPWMKCVNMVLVTNETLHDCIEHCINAPVDPSTGNRYYSLDLETTGLDSRVFNGATKDMIVGVCLSPDGRAGYYIPVRHIGQDDQPSPHNVSYTLFKREFLRLVNSDAIAIFHNAKFDQEFLEFTGEEPFGNWDDPKSWEDTLILDYLRDNRARQHGLKFLSSDRLKVTQLKINELFPKGRVPKNKNFALLDPSRPGVLEYAAGDAICTYLLYFNIRDETLLLPSKYASGRQHTQITVYNIEKLCCTATRWMERNRIKIDRKKVAELIQLGQKDYIDSLTDIYQSASQILGRDIAPLAFYLLLDDIQKRNPDLDAYHTSDERSLKYMQDEAKKQAKYIHSVCGKGGVAMLGIEQRYIDLAQREAPANYESEYDVSSQQQLGVLLKELQVPDLEVTEGSGQVKTSKDFIEAAAEKHGKTFPFLIKIKRFREVQKALSTYLYALYEDACEFMVCNDCNRSFTGSGPCSCGSQDIERDNSIKINFRAFKTDTGRFSCPQGKNPSLDGVARFPLQGTPAGYDSSRPKCMQRMRECFIARKGKFLFAIDFSGVELRLVTNLSGEPKWLKEYFRCSDCSTEFSRGDGKSTPPAPPTFCPACGSDKIGDIHTLTGLTINGPDAKEKNPPKIWKKMRKDAKGVNFGLCYGGGPAAVVRATNCTYEKAKSVKRTFDESYNTLFSWWETERKFARKYGYVRTAFGRKCPLPDIHHEDRGFRAKAERNATNAPIQGSSADITKLAMGLVYKEVRDRGWFGKVNMLITMHDELVFEIDFDIAEEAADVIMGIMTRNAVILGRKWAVPLTVDCELGYDWTVPWNLTEFRYGKEPWPEDLKPYFTSHLKEKVSEESVEGESVFYFTVPYLNDPAIETIARALCESRGGQDRVELFTVTGEKIPWADEEHLVDAQAFYEKARSVVALVKT